MLNRSSLGCKARLLRGLDRCIYTACPPARLHDIMFASIVSQENRTWELIVQRWDGGGGRVWSGEVELAKAVTGAMGRGECRHVSHGLFCINREASPPSLISPHLEISSSLYCYSEIDPPRPVCFVPSEFCHVDRSHQP